MTDDHSDNLPAQGRARPRTPAVPADARETFLEFLRKGHTVSHAAGLSGVAHRQRMYELREADPEFRAAWEDAWLAGNDALVEEARRRAVEGWDEPIASAGKIVGLKRVYDSRLFERLLAARIPAFRNQPQTTLNVSTGVDGTNVTLRQVGVSFADVAEVLRKAGKLPEIEAPADTAEILAEIDESAE